MLIGGKRGWGPARSGAQQAPGRGRPRVAADAGEGLPSPADKKQRGPQAILVGLRAMARAEW